ncbi:hypothetical protein Sjap_000380 [Stephania japonica]|uniref:Uncharacterized protein n=1 Tax=Stephania japonica TaxID=461633 RepID=A0AAP0KIW4_9MAGN
MFGTASQISKLEYTARNHFLDRISTFTLLKRPQFVLFHEDDQIWLSLLLPVASKVVMLHHWETYYLTRGTPKNAPLVPLSALSRFFWTTWFLN